jgi:hypothetical protein
MYGNPTNQDLARCHQHYPFGRYRTELLIMESSVCNSPSNETKLDSDYVQRSEKNVVRSAVLGRLNERHI